uniref:HisKA domain-containing protein n=1 Tax=Ascaris lumbricoides TaxID=6252 RepID=A0A0M3ITV5_ASCLU
MIHQNERTKDTERQIIAPHLHMIGTLLSIVANVEEQKRLARQSQIFLSMAQNVFSSLRKSSFFL